MPTKRHWCSWSRYRSTTTYADCLSGFFHAQQLQRQWSAFFLKSGLLVRPHRARMTDSLLEMLVFLKYNSCLIWDIGLMSTHNNWNNRVLLIMLIYSFSWTFVCLGWVVRIGSVIGFITRSLGFGLVTCGQLALALCLQALLTTLVIRPNFQRKLVGFRFFSPFVSPFFALLIDCHVREWINKGVIPVRDTFMFVNICAFRTLFRPTVNHKHVCVFEWRTSLLKSRLK